MLEIFSNQDKETETLINIIAFYCCVILYHKLSGLEHHQRVISRFQGVKSLGTGHLGCLLRVSRGWNEGVSRVVFLSEARVPIPTHWLCVEFIPLWLQKWDHRFSLAVSWGLLPRPCHMGPCIGPLHNMAVSILKTRRISHTPNLFFQERTVFFKA